MTTHEQQSILAAEILGWEQCQVFPDGQTWGFREGKHGSELPLFHSDANASLQLVEWMAKHENGDWTFATEFEGEDWHVIFAQTEEKVFESIAPTLPLAILGAFLKANNINPEATQ